MGLKDEAWKIGAQRELAAGSVDPVEASHLLGQAVRYDIANVFNPAYCVAARLEKTELTRAMSFRARG